MAPPPAADNFAQNQPITTALKTILKYYPEQTCLRELLQNADDAGATEIEYVLDTRTYSDEPLISSGLEEFQGPALLARNNSVFREEDFNSLASVGDSIKREDPSSTGKFGQGFNAVYHWTDGPWIYSRNWLLVLDPHQWWSRETGQPGGPRWDVVKYQDSVEIQNHLKTFSAFGLSHRQRLDQTIIRIPLRTEHHARNSKISDLHGGIQGIKHALKDFSQEVEDGGLLFLKNISNIIIRVDNDLIMKARVVGAHKSNAATRNQLRMDFKNLYGIDGSSSTQDVYKYFELAIEYTSNGDSKSHSYAVQHAMMSLETQKKSLPENFRNIDIKKWARGQKLFPWVAVAAPLKGPSNEEAFTGRLFTILRLPGVTIQPVHIHGLFSLPPDRGKLIYTVGTADESTLWNKFMLEQCVASAWAKLLERRSSISWDKEKFGLWPKADFSNTEKWNRLDDDVIDMAINFNLAIWNSSIRRCVDIEHGYFIIEDSEALKYRQALAQVNLPAVYLEDAFFQKLQQRAKLLGKKLRLLKPSTVRRFLRWEDIPSIPEDVAALVLEYCLSDAIKSGLEGCSRSELYNDLSGIRLWPTVGGTLSIYDNLDLLLPRDDNEMHLFAKSRASQTLDLSKMSDQVRRLLLNDISNLTVVMRFRTLAHLATDWPTIYPIVPNNELTHGWALRSPNLDKLLSQIWSWIFARVQEGQRLLPAILGKLYLIPANDNRIRHYAPDSSNSSILIVEKGDPLFGFLVKLTSMDPLEAPPLLDIGALPVEAVNLLRKNPEMSQDIQATLVDCAETFIQWLVAGKELLRRVVDDDINLLLNHLEGLVMNLNHRFELPPSVVTQMRKLPIYHRTSSLIPYKEHSYVRSSLDLDRHMYKMPSGLPPLPDIVDVSFYDPRHSSETIIIDRLKGLDIILPKDLLARHLLPWFMEPIALTTDDSRKIAKDNLLEWIMKASRRPSKAWLAEVMSRPIIPLPLRHGERKYRVVTELVDPSSELAKLYSDDEEVFPCPDFFSRHKETLLACGILSKPTAFTPLERARYYAQQGVVDDILRKRVELLMRISVDGDLMDSESSIKEIRELRWLPGASLTGQPILLAPNGTRGAGETYMIDLVLGTTNIFAKTKWKRILGWDRYVATNVLLQQFDSCLLAEDYDKANRVLSHIDPRDHSSLRLKVCLLGRSGKYFTPDKAFLPFSSLKQQPLAPHLDEVNSKFASEHAELLEALEVRHNPSTQDLQDVQSALLAVQGGRLCESDRKIAISVLEIAMSLDYDSKDLLVPDTTSTLRAIGDIVHGEPLSTGRIMELNYTHSDVSARLARGLRIDNAMDRAIKDEIDTDSEDETEFAPQESLTTVISDTLERYPLDATFNEFLANADDARATKIVWTLDQCDGGPHASSSLLTRELKPFQGSALLVYNDGMFSKKDFSGLKDIGQGSKRNDITSTGMFGRGALSMYHFTDIPTIVSADSFLVLDPQEQVLPVKRRSRRRRVGTKVPLSAVNRLAADQLAPFHGLHGFSQGLHEYKGSVFRFPFRKAGAKSRLKDTAQQVDSAAVKAVLQDYFSAARTALLFLNNIESIEFYIRGQPYPQWSVIAKRTTPKNIDMFRQVEITSTKSRGISRIQHSDTWCVACTDINEFPAGITRSGRSSEKSAECGIAACLMTKSQALPVVGADHDDDSSEEATIEAAKMLHIIQRVFCRLPTRHESFLPVSLNASFAVTGDRRAIALENTAENSAWNRWLLENCISGLYLDTLQYLAPKIGQEAFKFFPILRSSCAASDLSGTVSNAFWKRLADEEKHYQALFPLLVRHVPVGRTTDATGSIEESQRTTSLSRARFDFLSETKSQILRPLLIKLFPFLVRPPQLLRLELTSGVLRGRTHEIDIDCLSQALKVEENCKLLDLLIASFDTQEEKRSLVATILSVLMPKANNGVSLPLSVLDGCRILPRPKLDLPLGALLWNPQPGSAKDFVATEEEQELFAFAASSMVNTQLFQDDALNDSLQTLLNGPCNIQKLDLSSLGALLAGANSPTDPSCASIEVDTWMPKFWCYLNPKILEKTGAATSTVSFLKKTVQDVLHDSGLIDQAIYRVQSNEQWRYLTPRQFEVQPCIVKPKDERQGKMCEQIPGLQIADRDCVPSRLVQYESDLRHDQAFSRLLKSMKTLQCETNIAAKNMVTKNFNVAQKDLFADLALEYLISGNSGDNTFLRRLPIWRRYKRSQSAPHEHVAAEDASFCAHDAMLMPWVKNLTCFVLPQLVTSHGTELSRLGVPLLTEIKAWELIKGDLPPDVKNTGSRKEHLEFVRFLSQHAQQNRDFKPSGKLAPNGASILCETQTLYDHQDDIFSAAFREQKTTRFLHSEMQLGILHRFWVSLGLRKRPSTRVLGHEDYLACCLAIDRRWDHAFTSPVFTEDSAKVAGHLNFDNEEFHLWPRGTWLEIAKFRMFRVRDVSANESSYRRSRMQQVANEKSHCALKDATNISNIRIMWSQSRFLIDPPNPYVYQQLPNGGVPPAARVIGHLNFLMVIINDVSQADLAEYLYDVQACYDHLQNDLEATRTIPGIRDAPIWLNLHTTQVNLISKDFLETNRTSASLLCLNSLVDCRPLQVARKFLIPYEKLLMSLGCKSVVQPAFDAPNHSLNSRESSLVASMTEMRRLRDNGQLVDVYLEAGGTRIPAHRVVLASVSEYCRAMLAGPWGDLLKQSATVPHPDLTALTLTQMVDFAYTGDFIWPVLKNPEDNAEVEQNLSDVLDLLKGTDMWGLGRLHRMTQEFLTTPPNSAIYVRPDTVETVKREADEANASRLTAYCDAFLAKNEELVVSFRS